MGIDTTAIKVLAAARSLGADFRTAITIGRQSFVPSPAGLANVLGALRIECNYVGALVEEKYSEPFFRLFGSELVHSIDYSDYEGATCIHDMNLPLLDDMRGRYSLVFDGGSLEHIFNAPQALRNCMELLRVGGYFVQVTNGNNFMGHGFWQFSPELMYRVFSPQNGFEIKGVLVQEVSDAWRGPWYLALDPQQVGWRVEVRNRRPTYVITIAKRVAQCPIFEPPPQQSDYARLWEENAMMKRSTDHKRTRAMSIRRMIPASVERAVRSPYNSACFIRLDEKDLLRGQLPNLRPRG